MRRKHIIRIAIATALLLLIPLIAMRFTDEVAWTGSDFVIAGTLLFGAGLAYEFASGKTGSSAYRLAVAAAVASSLMLIWANLAVGLIGNEDNPANMLYFAVIIVGLLGAIIGRLKARNMMRTLFAMAATQLLVPVVAFAIWRPQLSVGVLQVVGVSAFFAVLFVASGLLFRNAVTADSK